MSKVVGAEFRTLADLTRRLQELEQEIKLQVVDLNKKATTIVTWSFDINERLKRLDQREQDVARRERALLDREDKIRDYTNIEARMQAHDQELKNAVNMLTLEKRNLEARLKELESRESTVNNLAMSLGESISEIAEKLEIIKKIEGTLNEGLSAMNERVAGTTETTAKRLNNWAETLQTLFETKSKELRELESGLRSQMENVTSTSKEIIGIHKNSEQDRQQVMQLINRATNILASLGKREEAASQKEDDVVRREQKLGDLQRLDQDLQKREKQFREGAAELKTKETSLSTYATELAKSRKQVDETLRMTTEFQKQLQKDLAETLQRSELQRKEMEELGRDRKKTDEREKQVAFAQKELEARRHLAEEQIQTLKDRSKKLEEGVGAQVGRLYELNKSAFESNEKQVSRFLTLVHELNSDIKQMTAEATTLKSKTTELAEEQSRLQSQVTDLSQRKKQLETEISSLDKSAERLHEILRRHREER